MLMNNIKCRSFVLLSIQMMIARLSFQTHTCGRSRGRRRRAHMPSHSLSHTRIRRSALGISVN